MNDQSQMMNQQPPQMLNQMISQPLPPQIQMMAQPQAQQSQIMMMNQSKQQSQPLPMLNRGYNKVWPQHASMDHPSNKFQSSSSLKPNYTAALKPGRSNWKGKKVSDKHKNPRRMEKSMSIPMPMPNPAITGTSSSGGGYKPPALYELQSQNRFKARKFHQKKKYNNRVAPYAPRNTTSFIIRAKKTGGIADLVSPCPVTPAVLPTPIFSPSREVLGDMAKEEWGVDGYGSMKGLIRLRSPGGNEHEEEEEEENGGSSESDVEEHVEVERRLDHDLSRFEMIYPNYSGLEYHNVLENRVDDQDSHIAQLEEENLTLKERLFLMERELGDLRRRLQFLERQNQVMGDVNEEVVENGSENDSEGGLDAPALMGCENNADMEYVPGKGGKERTTDNENDVASGNEGVSGACMEEFEERNELLPKEVIADQNERKGEEIMKENVVKDAEMRTESVRNEVIAVENGAKNEERRSDHCS
ncbi:hypothetical protein I3843_14G128200 [Carya illinoinensis]|uniref:PRLI-interacting factor A n=1 Tax=Carya illinoinensis TaxID=32201 RepID=A0A8T1NMR1_CARIL|nr:uncharacterized protein LOC122293202 [Carya illinoinensis]XP_042957640.1 uncharacterized protein LOC122293202 [Carya illinoinensis]KAG6620717.1 hypothetical protein I3842_Q051000 [Carya illinoinensis]KAG6630070.1 hypothetical protein CIPAW_14G129600 [Carya illinoinensis]KAG7948070.1 hypothetical protein I3843_14G128200 [Carya illinoinensis]